MALCKACQAITLSSVVSDGGHLLHGNWESLQISARTCSLCEAILVQLGKEIKKTSREHHIMREQKSADSQGRVARTITIPDLPFDWYKGCYTAIRLRMFWTKIISHGDTVPSAADLEQEARRLAELSVSCAANPQGQPKPTRFTSTDWWIGTTSVTIEMSLFVCTGDLLSSQDWRTAANNEHR